MSRGQDHIVSPYMKWDIPFSQKKLNKHPVILSFCSTGFWDSPLLNSDLGRTEHQSSSTNTCHSTRTAARKLLSARPVQGSYSPTSQLRAESKDVICANLRDTCTQDGTDSYCVCRKTILVGDWLLPRIYTESGNYVEPGYWGVEACVLSVGDY